MIQVENLHFAFGHHPVLQGIELQIEKGEILSILGPNGCGKSTLLRLLRGILSPDKGQVLWKDKAAGRVSRKAMAQFVAVVPQANQVGFPFPVRELVEMGRFAHHSGLFGRNSEDHIAVEKALALTDTIHLSNRQSSELSGGELQRVILARALAQETPVLMLDEATSQLDLDHRLEFAELLQRLNRERGTTIIQISHDLDQAAEISDRILLLTEDGSMAALGTPEEVYTPANLKQVFRVEVQVEKSPYTGAPHTYPVRRYRSNGRHLPRLHLLCGGGSGSELLRRLHLYGCQMSVGPLNRGDSDQILAGALGIDTVLEEAFCPISPEVLQACAERCRQAELLVVAPTAWGPGNLACLELVRDSLRRGTSVILVDPREERDYTGGQAWQALCRLQDEGARVVDGLSTLLEQLVSSAD